MSASRLGRIVSRVAIVVVALWVVGAPPASATAPPPATACAVTADTFVDTTDVVVPTIGPVTRSSTITVGGQPIYLTDVDALTSITHSYPGDLDITIASPFGTASAANGGPMLVGGDYTSTSVTKITQTGSTSIAIRGEAGPVPGASGWMAPPPRAASVSERCRKTGLGLDAFSSTGVAGRGQNNAPDKPATFGYATGGAVHHRGTGGQGADRDRH